MVNEFTEPYNTYQTVSDVIQKPSPVYYNEQIDQLILTPETKSNLISKKVSRVLKKPIFELDDDGNRVPIIEEDGSTKVNSNGEIQYALQGYEDVEDGYKTQLEVIPAPEIFTSDNGTSNISQLGVSFLTRTYWFFNVLAFYQHKTKIDYSGYLLKLRNDAITVLQASKSYNGGTIQAIKTFINKTDSKQWLQKDDEEIPKKSPLSWITGGNKRKKQNDDTQKFTSYA